jgi:benzoate-CoA ligase family protein
MKNVRTNSVDIDASQHPTRLRFSPQFNAVVPFIDRHAVEGRGAKVAIRTVQQDITYSDLACNVGRCARVLTHAGIGRGERLVMVVKDCPSFFYLFWGAIKAGIIPVPLNTLLRQPTYTFMIDDSAATAVVYSPEYASEIEPAVTSAQPPPRIVLQTVGTKQSLAALMDKAEPQVDVAGVSAMDDCFWLYSSGSTGRPKAAVHRHRDMAVTSQLVGVDVFGLREQDICYSEAKLFFAYGLGNNMTFPLWVGATAVLNDQRPGPASSFPLIQRFRPSVYFSVPTLYAAYLEAFEIERPDLSSIRVCVSAGEALPPEILRRWQEKTGLTILDGIGSTEALHIFISNTPDHVRPGSSGRPVPGYRVRIRNENGSEAAEGESGRLWVSGESAARCYWNDPVRTTKTMQGDWLDTGDTYRRDMEGYYYYCGRSDDMLKVGGIWCSPFEIESRLVEHPSVLEAAVVGRTDKENLVKPEAFIVLRDGYQGSDALAAELLMHCKEALEPYKYPRWINFVLELPKTATGKVQRFALRAPPTRRPQTSSHRA